MLAWKAVIPKEVCEIAMMCDDAFISSRKVAL